MIPETVGWKEIEDTIRAVTGAYLESATPRYLGWDERDGRERTIIHFKLKYRPEKMESCPMSLDALTFVVQDALARIYHATVR